ncbi:UNVERIFIED_CONTAM: hypothetical protein PYX00_004629 [Menopon gallinae]|uniref:Large ribosomal subunit protein bL21m n=1 Tax=Menopon gallinae TaxID=328185 RepID=A0AAW2I5T7_9NEOP
MLTGPCAKLFSLVRFGHQTVLPEKDEEEIRETKDVIEKVNNEIHNKTHGRLFAVVQVCGKQFKVTDEDLIVVDGYWPPTVGDKIRLEKVLLVGSKNFTLIGRPLLPQDQVSVYATIIEKTMTPTILWFAMRRRKRYKKTRLYRIPQTFIRINSIDVNLGVNEIGDVDGLRDRIFQWSE